MRYGHRKSEYLGLTAVLLITAIPYLLFAWNAVYQLLPGPHGDANHLNRGREVFIAVAFFVSLPINFIIGNILAITERLRSKWHFVFINSALAITIMLVLVELVVEKLTAH